MKSYKKKFIFVVLSWKGFHINLVFLFYDFIYDSFFMIDECLNK